MRKKNPISGHNDGTLDCAVTPPSDRIRARVRDDDRATTGLDLSTILLGEPIELRTEALAACVKQGDCIGKNKRFEITGRLGTGGMGAVFSATDRQLERSVAIKFILPDTRISWTQLVKILRREATATARLRHDNIVAIFDIATWKKVPYLVMEHLDGRSLAQMLAEAHPGPLRATEIMIDVARGISHAHENGIVHRDLKPSNVFVLKEGRAKVLDFGLAAFAQLQGEPTVPGRELNPSGGTPTFMAPEQWRGGPQDERTDIWAMGVMLFELFTGQYPFPSTDILSLYREVCSRNPAPSVLSARDNLPEQIERIVARALQKEPEARFQRVSELVGELTGLQKLLVRSSEPKRAEPLALQRRQLTFLSCSLMSLPRFTEDSDEEVEFVSRFASLCRDIINVFSGRTVSIIGSKVLACFGHPVIREGDAERAVRAGLRIIEAVTQTDCHKLTALPGVRVGIHTGMEVVEDVEEESGPFHSQGTTPQIATSLETLAANGAVVVSDPTRYLVRGVFEFEHLGSLALEVASQPIEAFRILRERDIDSRFDAAFTATKTPLVGREADIERLAELWRSAKSTVGRFVLVSGEAGIGKSRLVRVFKDFVETNGGASIGCQCWPQFRTSAFHPAIELVLKATGILRQDSTEEKIAKLGASLLKLGMDPIENVPLLASLLSIPYPVAPGVDLDSRERKKRTIGCLTTMLLGLANKSPLLLVIEDLHWADHSTMELLGALLESLGSAPLLVVGTARPEFRTLWPEHPHFHPMQMSHLSPNLAATMVQRTAGDCKLPQNVIEALVRRTEGVPLFIEEMTHMVVSSIRQAGSRGAVGDAALTEAMPPSLHELFLARFDRLPKRAKELAQIGSVIGRSFSHTLIEQTSGMDDSVFHNAMFSLNESEVLICQGQPPNSNYQFKHYLIQDAVYHSLPKKKRKALHVKVARTLSELLPETAEIQPELLAHHYTEADDIEQGLLFWERAGRRAAERSANIEAISHFSEAIQMLLRLPESRERDCRELTLQLALGAPLMTVRGYAAPEVEGAYGRARELCRRLSEDIHLFPALQGLWQFYMVSGELPIARELAEQLFTVAGTSGDSTLLLLAYRSLGTTAFLQGEIVRCRELTELGLGVYDQEQHGSLRLRYGHDPGVAHGVYAAWAVWLLGYPEQAQKRAMEALTLAQKLADPVSEAFARCYLAVVQNSCGQYLAAAAEAAAAKTISNTHQLALWLSVSTMMKGWAQSGQGDSIAGIAHIQEGVAAWRRTGARAGMTFFLVTLAEAFGRANLPEQGMAILDEAESLVSQNSEHYYEAELHRIRGELRFALDPQHQSDSEAEIELAIAMARQQQAKALELRAAMSLYRLRRATTRAGASRQHLHDVYAWFSEGHSTADLVSARNMLGAFPSSRADLT